MKYAGDIENSESTEITEKIRDAALEEFQEHGLKFTMSDVSHKLHISKKTIYRSYISKEELMEDMLDRGFEKIQHDKAAIMKQKLPITDKIRQTMIAMPDQYRLVDFRLMSDLHEKYPAIYRKLRKHLEENWEPVIALLEEGIRKKEIRNISVPVLRSMTTATIEYYLSSEVLKDNGISYEEGLNEMMDIIMNGIGMGVHSEGHQ